MPNMKKEHEIVIQTQVRYLADQSDERADRFVFAYTIKIINLGKVAVRLVSRHWFITNALNHIQEVQGEGVVGEQPMLRPNQSFEYTSGTVLATQVGTMRGSYQMHDDDGYDFDVEIPEFVLSVPRVLH